jgi:hypothetical protein
VCLALAAGCGPTDEAAAAVLIAAPLVIALSHLFILLLARLSCKGRGVCPSCTTRRMHDTAAHLVDRVVPHVPIRQWTLSFPPRLRFALARYSKLWG